MIELKTLTDEQIKGMNAAELDAVSFSDDLYTDETIERVDVEIDRRRDLADYLTT